MTISTSTRTPLAVRTLRPLVIGVTGSFGTGKSTVALMIARLAKRDRRPAVLLDADKIAHLALRKGSATYRTIVRRFGPAVLGLNGGIDRRALAKAVFGKGREVRFLNSIIHPFVIGAIERRIARSRAGTVVVIDAPLLIEAGMRDMVDLVVVVRASRPTQVKRCREKFGISAKEVGERLSSQMPLGRKIGIADVVIDNDGSTQRTERDVRNFWRCVWR